MKCIKCNQEINEVNICPYCGANQVETTVPNIETKSIDENNIEGVKQEELTNTPDNKVTSKKNNKMFYIIFTLVALLVLVIFIYIVIQYLNPKIEIAGIKNEYKYSEIANKSFSISGSMFIKDTNTVWIINGYEFNHGSKVDSIPVVIGENTLEIKNNGASNTYYFEVINDTSLLTEGNYTIISDYMDFDGDGISNIVEDENNTSTRLPDTDGDGLYDNVEMIMGLDPNKKDSYDEVREYKVVQDNDKSSKNYLLVNSKGNVANTYLDTVDMTVGFSSTFIQSHTLKVTTTNQEVPDDMNIFFNKESSWNLENYSIYMFNESTGELKELPTKINDKYLIASINEFDNIYFVGNKNNVPKEYLNQIIILIDNSGSMFRMEDVTSNPNANPKLYNHDPDFKRIDLMSDLVEQLGTDEYEYSVYAFTSRYCELIKYSKNATAIKTKINSLRTECQKGGTDMSGAIKKYASTFKDDVYGAKYMIVLTDGIDSGNNAFNLSEYYLNDYRKRGIHIITLGLSSDVDSEYLMNIAYLTKGKYLFASDANMLDTLSDIIESSINTSKDVIKIDDKEYSLVADSGFQIDRDGFSFKNFGSTDSNTSNSYGFSYLSKLLYVNNLYDANGKSEVVKDKLTKNNSARLIKGNVYNIELSEEYNKILYSNDEYIDLSNTNSSNDDYQLLQIINSAFKVQSKIFLTKLNDYVLKHFQGQFFDYDTDLNKMIGELQSGSPAILSLSSEAGNHSVLATKIYKARGSDEYVITVYDSDNPGIEGKIYLKRTTAYYEFANSTYYTVDYESNGIKYSKMLYVDQR